jgi:hypothetical protein
MNHIVSPPLLAAKPARTPFASPHSILSTFTFILQQCHGREQAAADMAT